MRWFLVKLSRLFRRGKQEAELDAELQFHLDQLVDQYRREGMSEREAREAARREFGEVAAYREEVRDSWRPPGLADLWRAIRFAVRSLARSPGFSALAVVMLALGIGANTVMFSAFNSIILKPLPYPGVAQLDRIDRATDHDPEGRIAPADFADLLREAHPYADLAAYALGDASLSERGQPAEMVRTVRATPSLFGTLRVVPELGRDFRPGEDVAGNDRVVIISRRFWRNRFGGRADVIGRTIRVDGVPHDIVGVLPASFNDWRHLGAVDLFRPLVLAEMKSDRQNAILRVIGRRPEGVAGGEARAFIAAFGARLAKDFPSVHAGSAWHTIALADTMRDGRSMMAMLIGLSGFVLLIVCSNLANLLLARTMGRSRELALRAALGASRRQLLHPIMTESLILALAGAGCALLVASWLGDWLAVRSTGDNGERVILAFDWRVFGWALGAALVTAVAFSLAPALFALRLNLNDTLKSGARGMTGSRGHRRFRSLLIVGQFALAMVLLAGAGLFIRGLDELNHRRAGWDSAELVTGTVALPRTAYPDAERITAFDRRTVQRLQSLPGVAAVSISTFTPFFTWFETRRFVADGRELPEPGHEPIAVLNAVTPQYFDTYGTRLVAGRVFDDRDSADAPDVYIINQAMATGLFGNENPIGRRLTPAGIPNARSGQIVGIAADVRSVLPDRELVTFQLYRPMAQEPRPHVEIAVRAAGVPPAVLVESIRGVMTEIDPDLPVRKLQTANATLDRANYELGVLRDMLIGFALLGLSLATLGIYGIIARTMAQRTSEFAIRFALGAAVRDVTKLVLASGLKLALLGAAIGVAGAYGVARLLAFGFPNMQLESPPVLAGTTLLLIAVALLACWLPARRAARINPACALREE